MAKSFPRADNNTTFPDRVLVFNYQNGGWAEFTDSFTCFGTWQSFDDRTWADFDSIEDVWASLTRTWAGAQSQSNYPTPIAGNQQGFVLALNQKVSNDESLQITAITGSATDPVQITSPNHNLQNNEYVKISGVNSTGTPDLTILNDRVYQVQKIDNDNFYLYEKNRFTITAITAGETTSVTANGNNFEVGEYVRFSDVSGMTEINGLSGVVKSAGNTFVVTIDSSDFTAYTSGGSAQNMSKPFEGLSLATGSTYLGGGEMSRIMNFKIRSKKFNLLEVGKKNYLGYIDFLMNVTDKGEVACKIFVDYNDSQEINPEGDSDTFFNTGFNTSPDQFSTQSKTKEWHRFYCPTDAQFFEYLMTFNDRMISDETINDSEVYIDSTIIWSEAGGRLVD